MLLSPCNTRSTIPTRWGGHRQTDGENHRRLLPRLAEGLFLFPGVISEADKKAMTTVWTMSKEMGILKKVPDVNAVVWEHAITE